MGNNRPQSSTKSSLASLLGGWAPRTCKWLIGPWLISPQFLGLWDPFQMAMKMAYKWGLPTTYPSVLGAHPPSSSDSKLNGWLAYMLGMGPRDPGCQLSCSPKARWFAVYRGWHPNPQLYGYYELLWFTTIRNPINQSVFHGMSLVGLVHVAQCAPQLPWTTRVYVGDGTRPRMPVANEGLVIVGNPKPTHVSCHRGHVVTWS